MLTKKMLYVISFESLDTWALSTCAWAWRMWSNGEQLSLSLFWPQSLCFRWAAFVTDLCEEKYGHCPTFRCIHILKKFGQSEKNMFVSRISGHTHASFPYIEMPLDYILPELLKNAARATIESNPNLRGSSLPPVSIVLASNSQVCWGWDSLR